MYVIFICLYNFTHLHRGYDQAHSKSVLYKMGFAIFVFYNWSHSFIPHYSWMLSQFSNLKEISPNHYFKLSTFWEKVKTRLLETEFQTSKVIQIVFCLQGHIGTQSEDFFVSVRIPTPGADHHWMAALYYDEDRTQVQKLPAACGTNVWSPRAEIPNHLGTCGSMGYILANTTLKWFLFWTTCSALWVYSWYRNQSVHFVCFGCYLFCF